MWCCRVDRCRAALFLLLCTTAAAVLFCRPRGPPSLPSAPWRWTPCACRRCLREGRGRFRELIDRAPPPFLSPNTTAQADFNWWKGLQSGNRDFAFYNATVDSLFQIIPPVPQVGGARRGSCISCAVVGNSGRLRGSFHGPLIDYHDIVIRMNRGRTKGFERDVGTKTTHRVFYPESSIMLDNTTHLLFPSFKVSDLLWLLNKLNPHAKNVKRIANKDLVTVLHPAFMRYVHESWLERKGRYPSTGFLAFAVSLQMCDEVDVFGFGADEDGNWNHYFETLGNKHLRTGPHAGMKEYELIRLLSNKNIIQFF